MTLRADETAVAILNRTAVQLLEVGLRVTDYEKALIFTYGKCQDGLGNHNDEIEHLIQSLLDGEDSLP